MLVDTQDDEKDIFFSTRTKVGQRLQIDETNNAARERTWEWGD